jgi:hypothetical protein
MPLTINTKNCRNGDELWAWRDESALEPEGYYLEAKAQTLGFVLGMLGMGDRVTENNYAEVARRLALYEAAEGALCWARDPETGKRSPAPFTIEDVQRLIGLSTNWGMRRESRKAWMARVLADDAE